MELIRVILVDDEPDALRNLKWEIERFCKGVEVLDTFTDPEEAVSAINYLKPDGLFLDIEMPGLDGFGLLEQLNYRDFELVITTAYDHYALKAFKSRAIAYLLKPVDTDELVDIMKRIKEKKRKHSLGSDIEDIIRGLKKSSASSKLALPMPGRTLFVNAIDIQYCKADGNYTDIIMTAGKKEIMSKKIKDVAEILPDEFFRVHKSYIVNLGYVKELVHKEGNYIIMESGTSIPLSRLKKQDFIRALEGKQGRITE